MQKKTHASWLYFYFIFIYLLLGQTIYRLESHPRWHPATHMQHCAATAAKKSTKSKVQTQRKVQKVQKVQNTQPFYTMFMQETQNPSFL